MNEADRVVARTFQVPRAPVLALEPSVALTWLDEDGRLVVRSSIASAFRVRGRLAERLGLPAARIRVVQPLVGGGPGGKAEVRDEDLCALVTLRTGRPARLFGPSDEVPIAACRPAQTVHVRLAMRDGRMNAVELRVLMDIGASAETPEEVLRSAGRDALAPYDLPHVSFEAVAVRTDLPPAGALFAAEGAAGLALECTIDEAAAALGEDPVGFRRRHIAARRHPAAHAALTEAFGGGPEASSVSTAELLSAGDRESGWMRRWSATSERGPLRRGFGVAIGRRSAEAAGATGGLASLRLLEDGSFSLAAGPFAPGITDEGDWAEAAAAILGVPARGVVAASAEADAAPFDTGPSASLLVGAAVEEAARRMRDRILFAGARMLEAEPARARVENGLVRSPEGRAVSFAEIGAAALRTGEPLASSATPPATSVPPAHAAVFAEVEVDLETGIVRVTGLHAEVDGGPFDDPRPAQGQVEGALAAALGRALAESTPLDTEGRPLPHGRWPIPGALDIPPIRVTFRPTDRPPSRFGAAASAEAAGRAALAAIVNAVAQVVAERPSTLPLLPWRLLPGDE
jgi:putative selenate reductase molybdopterin-binding subunit